MADGIILLILLPFFGSLLCLLNKFFPNIRFARYISIGCLLLCLAILARLFPLVAAGESVPYHVGGWQEPIGITLYIGPLSWITSLIGMLITLLVLVFSLGEKAYSYHFYFLFLMMVAGMEGVVLTGDLFNMFVFIEILSITTYILIAYTGEKLSLMASLKYLLLSSLSIGFSLIGILIFYRITGTLSLKLIAQRLPSLPAADPSTVFAAVAFIAGVGVKAAFIPFHTWLPDAHAHAPHPVSAVLSGVMIKVSFIVIWRIVKTLDLSALQTILLWTGAVTAVLGAIWAFSQIDTKKILAFHSVSQMGFIVASFGVGTSVALTASLYHILNHALFKSLLFLSVGSVIHATGEREVYRLKGLGGKMPLLFACYLIGVFSICGIPPFNGYTSKSLISIGMKDTPHPYLFIYLAGIGTVASFCKLSSIFFRGKTLAADPQVCKDLQIRNRPSFTMILSISLLSVLCLGTGLAHRFWISVLSFFTEGESLGTIPSVYTVYQSISTVITVVTGVALYLVMRTKRGGTVLYNIRSIRFGLESSLYLFVVGFLLFAVLSWVLLA
jgi:hydrogenase-4 component B